MSLGSGSDHSELKIYPKDDTALVGSKKKFCCIVPEINTFQNFIYGTVSMPTNYTQVGQTYIFEVTVKPSGTWGELLACEVNNMHPKYVTLFGGCKSSLIS